MGFVDECIANFGMPMGPLTLADLVGLELFWKQRQARGDMSYENKISMRPYELGDWLCDQGRFGQKTGRGMYLYDAKTRKKLGLDPEVLKKSDEIIAQKGFKKRTDISEQEVVERVVYPLINEGFKILEEGYAQRPSDIDIVYAFGYGFPAYKGGPCTMRIMASRVVWRSCTSGWSSTTTMPSKRRRRTRTSSTTTTSFHRSCSWSASKRRLHWQSCGQRR